MKFKDLDNAVSGETVLVDGDGVERCFVAFNRNKDIVVTEMIHNGAVRGWAEPEIKDWHIKKKTKKFWKWDYRDSKGHLSTTFSFYDEEFKSVKGEGNIILANSKLKRKVKDSEWEIEVGE